MKHLSCVFLALLVAVVLMPTSAYCEKTAIKNKAGEIIGYKEVLQEGKKTIVTQFGPDGLSIQERTTTEVEERDDGTIITTVTNIAYETKPDGTRVVTTTVTVTEEYPQGPIAKRIIEKKSVKEGLKVTMLKPKITIIDRQGNIRVVDEPNEEEIKEPDLDTPTPAGER